MLLWGFAMPRAFLLAYFLPGPHSYERKRERERWNDMLAEELFTPREREKAKSQLSTSMTMPYLDSTTYVVPAMLVIPHIR